MSRLPKPADDPGPVGSPSGNLSPASVTIATQGTLLHFDGGGFPFFTTAMKKESGPGKALPGLPQSVTPRGDLVRVHPIAAGGCITGRPTQKHGAAMKIQATQIGSSDASFRTRGLPRHCLDCQSAVYPDDIFCVRCGRILPLICVECGTPVSHPVAFHCVRCGRKLSGEQSGRYR
jgi:hypothetical protein